MNAISYIILGIVVVAFVAVARYHFSGRNRKSCCDKCDKCHCNGC